MSRRMFMSWAAAASTLLSATASAGQELLLNGSFENHNAFDNEYNMSNALFNAIVHDATAWGKASEIDLMTFGGGFGVDPIHGNWHIALHAQSKGPVDAFSFHLSKPIVAGASYDLSFWASGSFPSDGDKPIEIGVSSLASSFGTLVFTSDPLQSKTWNQYTTTFIAPADGDYLTVRISGSPIDLAGESTTWAHLDNFSLVPAPGALAACGILCLYRQRRRRVASSSA